MTEDEFPAGLAGEVRDALVLTAERAPDAEWLTTRIEARLRRRSSRSRVGAVLSCAAMLVVGAVVAAVLLAGHRPARTGSELSFGSQPGPHPVRVTAANATPREDAAYFRAYRPALRIPSLAHPNGYALQAVCGQILLDNRSKHVGTAGQQAELVKDIATDPGLLHFYGYDRQDLRRLSRRWHETNLTAVRYVAEQKLSEGFLLPVTPSHPTTPYFSLRKQRRLGS